MTLYSIRTDDEQLWMGHGGLGQTLQEVVASRGDDGVRLSVRRVQGGSVSVMLTPEEVRVMSDWLAATPSPAAEAS